MKHKNIAALAKLGLFSLLMMLTTTAVNAQKQFTLEDLNFGGKTTITWCLRTGILHGGVTNS